MEVAQRKMYASSGTLGDRETDVQVPLTLVTEINKLSEDDLNAAILGSYELVLFHKEKAPAIDALTTKGFSAALATWLVGQVMHRGRDLTLLLPSGHSGAANEGEAASERGIRAGWCLIGGIAYLIIVGLILSTAKTALVVSFAILSPGLVLIERGWALRKKQLEW